MTGFDSVNPERKSLCSGLFLFPIPTEHPIDANSSILAKVKKIANSVQLPALVPAFA
jgi:hypothetical protein